MSGQQPVLEFDVKNVGGKPISAYTIAILTFDSGGKLLFKGMNISMAEGTGPNGRGILHPGGEEHVEMNVPVRRSDKSLLISEYQVVADYVVFADGTTWGPDTMKTSARIQGMREGIAMEKARQKDQPQK